MAQAGLLIHQSQEVLAPVRTGTRNPAAVPMTTAMLALMRRARRGDPIIDDPFVQEIFAILLELSNYSPNTPQDQRLEHYAWIIQTSTGYTFAPMGIPPAPCGSDAPVTENTPTGAVGWVHTHLWKPGEWQWVCDPPGTYWGLPSEADVAASAILGLPGYIVDAKNITKVDAAAGTNPLFSIVLQVPHCGRVS